jgi:hypothetical protein
MDSSKSQSLEENISLTTDTNIASLSPTLKEDPSISFSTLPSSQMPSSTSVSHQTALNVQTSHREEISHNKDFPQGDSNKTNNSTKVTNQKREGVTPNQSGLSSLNSQEKFYYSPHYSQQQIEQLQMQYLKPHLKYQPQFAPQSYHSGNIPSFPSGSVPQTSYSPVAVPIYVPSYLPISFSHGGTPQGYVLQYVPMGYWAYGQMNADQYQNQVLNGEALRDGGEHPPTTSFPPSQ